MESWGEWLPLVVAIIAVFGWTYKLNRDLRSDLLAAFSEHKKETHDNVQAHVHDDSGYVWLRALVDR